ncbi:hypothetical protein BGZ95_006878, partial [Linnemannia exigua]
MRFQSALFCLVVVLLTGTNLPTLVDAADDYNNCVRAIVDHAIVNGMPPAAENCTEAFRRGINLAAEAFSPLGNQERVPEMNAAFDQGLANLKQCLQKENVSETDIEQAQNAVEQAKKDLSN